MQKKQTFLANLIVLGIICFAAASCNGDFIYKKNIKIPGGAWTYEDVLKFDFPIEDTSLTYNLMLDVEHAGDYGFQNLYVKFHTKFPSGEVKTQMVSLELAAKSGIWNGKCSGNSCTVEIPLQTNAVFKEIGEHQISVEQFMRKNPLPGVEGMTLKISPAGKR
ncbi:MAG TPA: gliding motility lipoprotein GldH [Bacteroidetes bacterium]|nr:gliding motility lipoprotein GldH [Bacteroidota bacterium]